MDNKVSAADLFELYSDIKNVEDMDKAMTDSVDKAMTYLSRLTVSSNDYEAMLHFMVVANYIKASREVIHSIMESIKDTLEKEEDRIIREGE